MASIKKIQLFRNSGGVYMDKASFKELKNSVLGSDNGATTISMLGLQDGEPLVFRYGKGDVSSALAIAHTKYEGLQKNWLELFAPSDETTYSGGNGITIVNGSISLADQQGTGDKLARVEGGKIYYTDTNSSIAYTAGTGLGLSDTEFSLNVANTTALGGVYGNAKTESDKKRAAVVNGEIWYTDTDNNTTYTFTGGGATKVTNNGTAYTISSSNDLKDYFNTTTKFVQEGDVLDYKVTLDGISSSYNPITGGSLDIVTKYKNGTGITISDSARTITLNVANGADVLGGVYGKTKGTENKRAAVVNGEIWYTDTDNNTTYTNGTGLSLSNTTFSLNVAKDSALGGVYGNAKTESDKKRAAVVNGEIWYTDTTYLPFDGTKEGLVPKPEPKTTGFLNQDGKWEIPTNTKYYIKKEAGSGNTLATYTLTEGTGVSETITIPKDKNLIDVQVTSKPAKGYTPGVGSQKGTFILDESKTGESLSFAYGIADGTINVLSIAVGEFLNTALYKDGLEFVENGANDYVKAKTDRGVMISTDSSKAIILKIGGATTTTSGTNKGVARDGNMDNMLYTDDNGLHISNVIECGTF